MTTLTESFGQTHFGTAQLGDSRRTDRLVDLADRIYRHPGGTLPHKLHDPAAYKAMDRLVNRPEATHAAVLEPHRQHTLARMGQSNGVVLVLHDTTELDYSGLRSIADLGPIGGGLNRGYLCHNSLAVDGQRHEVVGLANQILHRRRHIGKTESVKTKRERADRESRLWIDGCDAIGAAPQGCCWVHVADRGADTFEFLARPWDERQQLPAAAPRSTASSAAATTPTAPRTTCTATPGRCRCRADGRCTSRRGTASRSGWRRWRSASRRCW